MKKRYCLFLRLYIFMQIADACKLLDTSREFVSLKGLGHETNISTQMDISRSK
jgi:hypothetical protein